ncbi:tautomerase family protein [Deinococcus hopiensis]|uniref:Phenylpyruvate tautomerase PptA, 4-oxalocrotonate tautomerase family n=1 Tax=Deinococcus hopiensis KR-140 TaxID=695939 RepID=A0A1W1USK0_9DEIO|nr:tautomerase family protein [Deinococcus hopiensis]SMB84000.1 Phenylpyruvate tautomerase PptA, 4-oxalocrotonate tautomerase family [Deinococcus hopiensis KR-140]
MPHVRISLRRQNGPEHSRRVSHAIHRALTETFGVPHDDLMQILTEHDDHTFIYDPAYLGTPRTHQLVLIQVVCNPGRTTDVKRAFYQRVTALLQEEANIVPDDVVIQVLEVPRENWSLSGGRVQGEIDAVS